MPNYETLKGLYLTKQITFEDMRSEIRRALLSLIFQGTEPLHVELLELEESLNQLVPEDPDILSKLENFEKELQGLFSRHPDYLKTTRSAPTWPRSKHYN